MVVSAAIDLKAYGPANVQLRVGSDGPDMFEINGCFSGTTVMQAFAGFNEVKPAVRWAIFVRRVPLSDTQAGLVLRYWEEHFFPWNRFNRTGQSESRTAL